MDSGLVAIVLGVLTLAGTFITVKYRDYFTNKPKKKDRLEVFLERYDLDIKSLSDRLGKTEKKLKEALELIEEKDGRIGKLETKLIAEAKKYATLLRRFNALKSKYEKSQNGLTKRGK